MLRREFESNQGIYFNILTQRPEYRKAEGAARSWIDYEGQKDVCLETAKDGTVKVIGRKWYDEPVKKGKKTREFKPVLLGLVTGTDAQILREVMKERFVEIVNDWIYPKSSAIRVFIRDAAFARIDVPAIADPKRDVMLVRSMA